MPEIEQLPDGVFLGLEEKIYFGQKGRLGSTDLAKLHTRGVGWWWSSEYNPDFVPEAEDAKSRTFGKALHALILEGEEALNSRFSLIPSKDEMRAKHGDLFCVTVGDIEKVLESRGMNPKKMRKDEIIAYARSRAPDLQVWDTVEAEWAKANVGKLGITAAERRQLEVMERSIRGHHEMGALFETTPDNVPISEVSILWTDEHGLKRRARLDALLPKYTIDLKTLTNVGQRPLQFAAGEHVAKWAYHCQMADHHDARRRAYRMILAGQVSGGTVAERKWLSLFPEHAVNWAYAWLLYQRPDAKAGQAPIVLPWAEDYGSQLHMDGIRARRRAIDLYRRSVAQFGLDKPWTRIEPVHSTAEGSVHRVFLPSWIAEEAIIGEDDEL